MRGTLLVYGPTDPAYLPLLRALGAHGFRLHILPNALVEPARAAGIDADDALAVLDAAARARVREARAALAARLRRLDVQLQAIFTAGPLALWDGMREAASAALVEASEQVAVMAAVVDALAAGGQLDGIVLGYDTLPAGRAAVETGRRLGVPTVLVPHAVLPRPRVAMPWQGARPFADVVCAPGAFSRAGYLAHGAAPDAVVPTGCPRWDEYAGLDEAGRRAARATVARALRLDPAAPLVVFGPSWTERSTANASQHVPAALAVYQGVLAALSAAPGGAQLVVKLHPGEFMRAARPEDLLEGYVGLARRAGVARIAVTAGYRADLLRAADLVVAVNSNLGLEALLCGRALVNVPLIPAEADALFPPDAGVLALGAPAETETAVARVLADAALRARLEAAAPALVRRYVHVPDGRASERVAGVVAECVRAARAAGGRQVVRAPAPGAAPPAATSVPGAGTGLAPAKAGASAERDGVTA